MKLVFVVFTLCIVNVSPAWWVSRVRTKNDHRTIQCACVSICAQGSVYSYNCNNSCSGKRRVSTYKKVPTNTLKLCITFTIICKFYVEDLMINIV